jgi:hypothetical protein
MNHHQASFQPTSVRKENDLRYKQDLVIKVTHGSLETVVYFNY